MGMTTMLAFKLMRLRKDGTLGPLFINARLRVPFNKWLTAKCHPTPGYAVRPGWHCCAEPIAPHLTTKGRVWTVILIRNWTEHHRPEHQGGLWYTAKQMKVLSCCATAPWRRP